MKDDKRQSLGKMGEDLACTELQRRGYAILARRYRTRFGEIDVIAREGGVVVFIEVKTRSTSMFGSGAVAVTGWKQRRIARMAREYLSRRRLVDEPCRFDVVAIAFENRRPVIEVFPNAFETE